MIEIHRNLVRNMKLHRKFLGMSQMELAERAGISPGFVGEIEMGRKFPSGEKLEKIAKALNLKPYRLLMGPEDFADALGPEATYEAAESIRKRLEKELDDIVSGMDPRKVRRGGEDQSRR